jgi:hypothetical protein
VREQVNLKLYLREQQIVECRGRQTKPNQRDLIKQIAANKRVSMTNEILFYCAAAARRKKIFKKSEQNVLKGCANHF